MKLGGIVECGPWNNCRRGATLKNQLYGCFGVKMLYLEIYFSNFINQLLKFFIYILCRSSKRAFQWYQNHYDILIRLQRMIIWNLASMQSCEEFSALPYVVMTRRDNDALWSISTHYLLTTHHITNDHSSLPNKDITMIQISLKSSLSALPIYLTKKSQNSRSNFCKMYF